jgi:26S proteasome regulatory subunit N7
MADEVVLPIPNLALPQHLFTLSTPSLARLHDSAREDLLKGIKAENMAPYYRLITPAVLPLDQELLDEMTKANQEDLAKLDERIAEAEKVEGESEISDALRARANYLTQIADKARFRGYLWYFNLIGWWT